jgi:phage FluMu protein Com/preprotein translocase subunit YajC
MAIEFRCTQCSKLLRTADDTAGKKAKCPACGTVLDVPSPGAPPIPGGAGGSPFAPQGVGQSPFAPAGVPPRPFDPTNPYASPSAEPGAPPMPPAGPLAPGIVDFNDAFGHTWQIFKDQMGMCIAGWVVYAVVSNAVSYGLQLGGLFVGAAMFNDEAIAQLFSIAGQLVSTLFTAWLFIGQAIFFLKIARGQQAEIGDLFAGGPFYGTFLGAGILFLLMYVGGLMLCIVPGIILGLMFCQFYFLIVDRNAAAMKSLEQSNELMKGNKMTVFAVLLVGGLVGGLLVVCTCLIGVFFVGPFMSLLPAVIYLAVTGQPNAAQLRQQRFPQQVP